MINRLLQANGYYVIWFDSIESFLSTPNLPPYPSSITNMTPFSWLRIISELFFMHLELVEKGDNFRKPFSKCKFVTWEKSRVSIAFCYRNSRKQVFEWMRLDCGWERRSARQSGRGMGPCFSECDAGTKSLSTPGKLLEMENLGPHPRPTEGIWTCHFNKTIGNSYTGFNLRSTASSGAETVLATPRKNPGIIEYGCLEPQQLGGHKCRR